MTDEMIALARRAVACRGWVWMPGMLAVELAGPGMSLTGGRPVRVDDCWHAVNVWDPDLSDPATLGCLLALVREAWNDLRGYLHPCSGYGWLCSVNGEHVYGVAEAEALVAALELHHDHA